MKKILLIIFIPFVFVYSQNQKVVGRVINEFAQPVIGASVLVVGTSRGTSTNEDGSFEINNLIEETITLQVSAISYEKKTVANILVSSLTTPIIIVLKEALIQANQIVVSAGKYEQRIEDLTVSTTVLQPEVISKKNHQTFDDLLRHIPGIQVNLEQVSIRGSSGYSKGAGARVLTALNGLPLYSGDNGDVVWEMIPTSDIDRVEIIKGPASSLYGSSAIGGVINIITKNSVKKPITNFKSYFGAYDKPSHEIWDWSNSYRQFYGAELTHSNSVDNLGYTFSLKKFDNDGYKQNNFAKRVLGYVKLNYDLENQNKLTFFTNYLSMNRGNFLYWKDSRNALVPKDEENGNTVKSNRLFTGMIYHLHLKENISSEIKASYYRTKFTGYGLEVTTSTADLLRGEALVNYKADENFLFTSGAEISYSNVQSNIFKNPTFFGGAAYAQAEYKGIENLILNAGLRYDYMKLDETSGKNAFTPRIGLNYKLSSNFVLRSSVGTGFRAPTPSEVFTSTSLGGGFDIIENPNLTYETSLSFEAGAHYTMQTISLDAAFYQTDYNNFIEPNLTKQGDIQFLNISKARIQGFEFVSDWNLLPSLATVSVGYNYMWSRDLSNNKSMKYRPRNTVYANARLTPGQFEFGFDFRYWSKVEEIDFTLSEPPLALVVEGDLRVPVYVADIMVGYNFFVSNIPAKVYLNAKNIFNYNYVEMMGNLAPIRNLSLSLELFF